MGGETIRLPRPDRPLVSVLVPAFRRTDLLVQCLRSFADLRREARLFETVLILNGAAPEVVELVSRQVAGATVVSSEVNRGIAGAFNLGATRARGDFLLLAQDDIQAQDGWIEGLLAGLERFPEAGAVGSLSLDFEGRLQSAGSVLWLDGSTSAPWEREAPSLETWTATRTEPFPVDYCGTCSLMIRRAVWRAVGGADERFFPAYYVDVDLCMAVRERGRTVLCAPGSRIRHLRGGSATLPFRHFLTLENRRRLRAKWSDALGRQAERTPPLREALAEAERRARQRAGELAAAFQAPAADAGPGEDPPAGTTSAVDYLHRELDLWERYAAWLEGQMTRRADEYSALEDHYHDLEAHARGLEASVGHKDEYIASLERELLTLRAERGEQT